MRKLNEHYDIIYCDLDNTLIYGAITDLMDITWKLFKSNFIAEVLMTIQALFRLYKTNDKLIYQIKQSGLPVVIMTARKGSAATHLLVDQLDFTDQGVCLVEMGTSFPETEKINAIIETALEEDKRPILFDDNAKTREEAVFCDIDVIDPTSYYEKKVG